MLIRTVKVVSPANNSKVTQIREFLLEYNRCVNYFIHRLWNEKKFVGKFLDKDYIKKGKDKFNLTARFIQCAGKQAQQIVKSQRQKPHSQRRMPRFNVMIADLDSRFWKISETKNSFEWLVLQSGFKVSIPFKRTRMWNKWEERGFTLSNSIRIKLIKKTLIIEFFFKKEKPPLKINGSVEGIDLGYVNMLTCSDGQVIGRNLNKIIETFAKREKHTYEQISNTNFHDLKSFNMKEVGTLVVENLHSVKSHTRGMFSRQRNRRLSHWLYAKVIEHLKQRCEEEGIRFVTVSPWKTSQYCRFCGNWDSRNRRGEVFECRNCGHRDHADMNAAQNIKLLGLAGVYSLRSLPSDFVGVRNECP